MATMNLVTYFTKSHKPLLDILLKSAENIENKIIFQGSQLCATARFREAGWNASTSDKLKRLADLPINNELYFFADADVVLSADFEGWCEYFAFNKPQDFIYYGYDTFQWCTGTMLFRQTEKVKRWWNTIYQICEMMGQNDQDGLHAIRASLKPTFLMDILPPQNVCNLATIARPNNPVIWDGSDFNIPSECKAWHSNWTLGIDQKIKMCEMVYKRMNKL